MFILNHWAWWFVLASGLWRCTWNFKTAPGTFVLKIQAPQFVDLCTEKACRYVLETCVGSGRSETERCIWSPRREYKNSLERSLPFLAEVKFDVDNVKSYFYFNANLTYIDEDKDVVTQRFVDRQFQYSSKSATLYSSNFEALVIKMEVICKPGFYPKGQCHVSCFKKPQIYECDESGKKRCLKGYVYEPLSDDCTVDSCSKEVNYCKNNGTCISEISGPRCLCKQNFSGDFCDKWNPCLNHKCRNNGKCIQKDKERNYVCHCTENYYGQLCEHIENPCLVKKCPVNFECKNDNTEAKCIKIKLKPTVKLRLTSTTLRNVLITTAKVVSMKKTTTETKKVVMEKLQVDKETVRVIQYHPFMNEYTTITIVIVFIIFMIGCFGVTFWILKIKYFHKKNKSYGNYPTLPIMPSVFNPSTYRNGEESFRRWHSLDDNSFYVCNQPQTEQYHTYRSGSNTWSKHEHAMENYGSLNDSHRVCHSMMRARMPMLCEPSTLDSSDINCSAVSDFQNNSEKVDDFKNNYLVIDNVATSDL